MEGWRIGGNAGVGQSPRRTPGCVERRGDQRVDVRLDRLDPRNVGRGFRGAREHRAGCDRANPNPRPAGARNDG